MDARTIDLERRVFTGGSYLDGTARVDGHPESAGRYAAHVRLAVHGRPSGHRLRGVSADLILTPNQARELAAALTAFAVHASGDVSFEDVAPDAEGQFPKEA